MSRQAVQRLLYWAVSILISGILLYFALRGVDWRQVWKLLAHANRIWLMASFLLTSLSFFMRSLRWRILLNAEAKLSVATVFWANMAGYLGNSFLPARAGEVLRSVLISGCSGMTKAFVLTTALSERLMDFIALVLCSSIVLLGITPKPAWMTDASGTMAAIAAGGAVVFALLPHLEGPMNSMLTRLPLPDALRGPLNRMLAQITLGARAFHSWARFGGFTGFTVVIWATDTVATVVGAHSLGLSLSPAVALLLLAGMGLGSALPSTPGYVGVYQFVAVTVLTPFGISRDGALAIILLAQAMGYILVLVYGLPGLYLLKPRTAAPA